MAWLFKFKNSRFWWVGHRLRGKQFMRSTGMEKREDAERELEKVKAQLAAHKANVLQEALFEELTGRKAPTITLKAALSDWMNEAKGATGYKTFIKYQAVERDLLDFFKADDKGPLLREVTAEDLQRYLGKRRAVVSASTANMSRKCLAIFFNRSMLRGYVRDNPMKVIPRFKAGHDERSARRPFKRGEIAKLIEVAPDDFWRYAVLAGYTTGLRLGDLVTMPIGAVDLKRREINITTRKTGVVMHIPIHPALYRMLSAIVDGRKDAAPTDPFWPDHAKRYEETGSGWFSQRFYDLLLVPAGLAVRRPHRKGRPTKVRTRQQNEVSFHCLRHSFVSGLASKFNQQTVKALAGHSTDQINDLYTTMPAGVLKKAVASLPDVTR